MWWVITEIDADKYKINRTTLLYKVRDLSRQTCPNPTILLQKEKLLAQTLSTVNY